MRDLSYLKDAPIAVLGIGHMNKEQLLDYMRNGNYTDR